MHRREITWIVVLVVFIYVMNVEPIFKENRETTLEALPRSGAVVCEEGLSMPVSYRYSYSISDDRRTDTLPPLPLSKRTRVILEAIRTGAAVASGLVTVAILLRVYGVL